MSVKDLHEFSKHDGNIDDIELDDAELSQINGGFGSPISSILGLIDRLFNTNLKDLFFPKTFN